MELRHLRYFVVVAEEQNVTRAAARLHLSQPPLTRQIHDLEEEMGVALFQRTAKSLALTEVGKIFLAEARAVLLRVDQAVETARAAAGARGELHVGYAPSLTVRLLPITLRLFERECPGVRVSLHDLSTEECLRGLRARKLDVALTVPPHRPNLGLAFEQLATDRICCAVPLSHPFATKKSLALRHLRDEPFVVYSRDEYPEYHAWLKALFRPFGFTPRLAGEYEGVSGLITAIEAGRGIAIVPTSLACLVGPRLRLLPLTPRLPPLKIGAIYLKPATPLLTAFLRAAKEAAKPESLPIPL